jgi:hypothetical protein
MLYVNRILATVHYSAGFVECITFDLQKLSKLRSVSTLNILKEDQQQVESGVLKRETRRFRRLLHVITGASPPQSFSQNARHNLTYLLVCYAA